MAGTDSPRLQGILKTDSNGPVSPSTLLGVPMVTSPRSTPKTVSISERPEHISPLILGSEKDVDSLDLDQDRPRRPKIKGPNSRKLSGRPPRKESVSSLPSLSDFTDAGIDGPSEHGSSEHHAFSGGLVGQVTAWIREERVKRAARKARRKGKRHAHAHAHAHTHEHHDDAHAVKDGRRSSASSDESIDLSRLEQILKESFVISKHGHRRPSTLPRRRHSLKRSLKSNTAASSDTEYYDGDVLVPSTDAWLDNSKTLSYSGGAAEATDDVSKLDKNNSRDAWSNFKYEIVRLTHTLRLKGWRRVPMELSNEIDVERLSGALTNAVYVVSPPANIPPPPPNETQNGEQKPRSRPAPPKLLLRIYGPQVEHLIDRDAELQILRRLARKKIGPRLLGTFSNGRFEEFFYARTLTREDLREPDTSKQIAKRMRELHEGIELLEQERDDGPFVWRNWDKWLQRVGDVVSWLDKEIQRDGNSSGADSWKARGYVCGVEWPMFKQTVEKYRQWLTEQYGGTGSLREQLVFAHNDTQYGNILRLLPPGESPLLLPANTHKQLVVIDFEYASANPPGLEFANHFTEWCYNYHDPATPHACNTNAYPTPEEQDRFIRAYVRHRPQFTAGTPKLSAQSPESVPQRPQGPMQSISNFMLDARAPAASTSTSSAPPSAVPAIAETNKQNGAMSETAEEDATVLRLAHETRLWRLANSAQWVAWGIVQAKLPGMPLFSPSADADNKAEEPGTPLTKAVSRTSTVESLAGMSPRRKESVSFGSASPVLERHRTGTLGSDPLDEVGRAAQEDLRDRRPDPVEEPTGVDAGGEGGEESEAEEFDYLAYAWERAMFFWGDAVGLGIVRLEDLPEALREGIKWVRY